MTPTALSYFFTFSLGAILGSFINVVALRFLRDESLWPRSYCYQCQNRVKPYDNVPVISWLLLGGKCRHCKARISVQYPLVELVTGLLFLATVHKFGFTLQAGFFLYMIFHFMVILITDFREQYIFDLNSLGLIPIGLLYNFLNLGEVDGTQVVSVGALTLNVPEILISGALAVLGAFLIFGSLNLFSRLIIGKPGFGEGDTRLLMGIGAFLGIKLMILVFVLGFLIQAAVGIPMLFVQWIRNKAYKTAVMMAAGMGFTGFPYLLKFWVPNDMILIGAALLFGLIGIVLSFGALRSARTLPSGLTYLPFGPALVFAALAIIFGQDHILALFRLVLPV